MARLNDIRKRALAEVAARRMSRQMDQLMWLTVDSTSKVALDLAKQVYDLSQTRVPLKTGYLKASGYVGFPKKLPDGSRSVDVGYRAPYASVQEDRTKFLSSSFRDVLPNLPIAMRQRRQAIATIKPIRVTV